MILSERARRTELLSRKEPLRRTGKSLEAVPLFYIARSSFPSSDGTKKPVWERQAGFLGNHLVVPEMLFSSSS